MNSNNAIDGNTRDAVEKDLMIQKWVSDIISELQQYLLPFFKDCIQYCLPTLYDRCNKNGEYETLVYYKLHEPKYLSDNSMTNDLTNSFSRVYPDLWTTFEKIKKIWPKALQREKDEMELLSTKYLTQKKCRHTYKNFTRDELGSLSVRSVRHCVKCHHTTNKND